jgi:hypothetical protein
VEIYVVETPAGVFAIDKDGSAIEKALFGKKAGEAAEKLRQLQSGIAIPELKEFIQSRRPPRFQSESKPEPLR